MRQDIDLLITNGQILTMDPDQTLIPTGAIVIREDTIVDVGTAERLKRYRPAQTIDAQGGIIMPGLVNAHTHAAMTCFRGLADDLPLEVWLQDHIFPAEAHLDYDMVYQGARLACAEMIMSGTTCFCDMYLFEDAVATAAHDAGLRAVVGEVLYDFPSPNYGAIEKGFDYIQMLIDKWRDAPLVSVAIEPHSPYLCRKSLLQKAHALAHTHQLPLVMHVAETRSEVQTSLERHGKTPVEYLAQIGLLDERLIACHCVALNGRDLTLLADAEVKVAHNPESNMKLASGVAPVPDMLQAGICVALGTDGCASNNNLDLFLEMDTAAKLHKVDRRDPTVMDADSVLQMATLNGAQALGLGDKIGALTAGRQADVIVIDTFKPHLTPMYRPASHLVYAVTGGDVDTVVVAGKVLMQHRRLTTIDVTEALSTVNRIAQRIKTGA
jgi:5-methylthioadenosine/S-adenosylhomocysteine deaminase